MHTGPLALQKLLVAASRAHAPAHATASGTVLGWPPAAFALERSLAPLALPGLVLSATAAETINEEQKRGTENPVQRQLDSL